MHTSEHIKGNQTKLETLIEGSEKVQYARIITLSQVVLELFPFLMLQ